MSKEFEERVDEMINEEVSSEWVGADLPETKGAKAKRFAKKALPAVGFTTVGVLIGVALTKKFDLIEEVINVIEPEVIESVVELGE